MKHSIRIIAVVGAVALVLALGVTAFASSSNHPSTAPAAVTISPGDDPTPEPSEIHAEDHHGQVGNADDDQVEAQNDDQVGNDDHGDVEGQDDDGSGSHDGGQSGNDDEGQSESHGDDDVQGHD